ncbi:MAG: hypothetical protein V4560_12465 [Bacteroidota bacterium]
MTIIIFTVHLVFAVLLFFIINWIGKHSYSLGYTEVTLFVKNEDAPASNFFIRVVTPIVYLIIISSVLYSIGADHFVYNIFFVNIYYLFFRLFFGLLTGRSRLINWYRQILYWTAITVISYVAYIKLISVKKNILPDFASLANELWIIILVFIFHVFNKIRISQSRNVERKDNYIYHEYIHFKELYGDLITTETKHQTLEAVVYAILIYENFNRPAIIRIIENLSFRITKKPHTLGVMQVLSSKIISDKESIKLGSKKVFNAFLKFEENYKLYPDRYYGEWSAYEEILANYNGGSSYSQEVTTLINTIIDKFYKEKTDTLIPLKSN